MIDLDRIEAIARAATQGEWVVRPDKYDDWGWVKSAAPDKDGYQHIVAKAFAGRDVSREEQHKHRANGTDPYEANALHVATMSPATTLALVEALKEWRDAHTAWIAVTGAEQELDRLKRAHDALLTLISGKQETNNDQP